MLLESIIEILFYFYSLFIEFFMKKLISFLFLTSLFVLFANSAICVPCAGGELIYELIPGQTNQYKFIFKFYRDCSGIGCPKTLALCYTTLAGQLFLHLRCILCCRKGAFCLMVIFKEHQFQQVVRVIIIPVRVAYYQAIRNGGILATVTLPSQCNTWKFWTGLCCRNGNIDNLNNPGSQTLYRSHFR